MSPHLHRTRRWAAWGLVVVALSPFALCLAANAEQESTRCAVTGRMTIAGKPAGDLYVCLDSGGDHCASGWVAIDGTFRVNDLHGAEEGMPPGHYHAHLFTGAGRREVAALYRDPATSELVIDVTADWNDVRIELP